MAAVDILTVREQKFGYAEDEGVTGGLGQASVVVTNLNDSGAGSLRTALSAGNRYITFDPGLNGGTITLASTLICSGSNITLDGVGSDITVTGQTTRFEGDNLVIAGMHFSNAGGISNDCITLRRPTTPTTNQRVLITHCTLDNPADPANTDTCLDIIWRRGWDTIVTVANTYFGRSKRGCLVHAGDTPAPGYNEERGWYYITFAYDTWHRVFERHVFSREAHIHMYNNYHVRYGGAASSGSGCRMGDDDPSPPRPNWTLAENNVVLPLDIGELDYLGVTASNPQEKWFGPSSSNNGTPNMRADGTYLKTNGSTTPIEEEIDPTAVGAPPYEYPLATANDELEDFIWETAGHPTALRTTLTATQFVNPATGVALIWPNQLITVKTEGDVAGVDLVIGSTTIPMTQIGTDLWRASAGSLTIGTETTIRAIADTEPEPEMSPLYPAFVVAQGQVGYVEALDTTITATTETTDSFTDGGGGPTFSETLDTLIDVVTDLVEAFDTDAPEVLDTTIQATTSVTDIRIGGDAPPPPPMQVIIEQFPPLDVMNLFEADVVRVERWVDIYESDNVTPWRERVGLVEGSVTVDMSRSERRNLDLTVYDDGTLPYGPDGFWYDKIFKPYRGIELPNGDIWATCLGEFLPDTIDRPHFPNTLTVTCRDFVKKLKQDKFPDTTTFAAGQNIGTVVKTIATNGGITKFKFQTTASLLSAATTFERDTERWQAMEELAQSVGFEVFFDSFGFLVFRPFVDPLTAPLSFTFQTGRTGNLVDFTKSTTDTFMFNDIIVHGTSQNNPLVWGRATNTNPSSPTRVAKVGRRMKLIPSSFVPTNTKAAEVAAAFLAVSGLEQFDMNLNSLVIPWLEAGDAIEVLDPDAAPGDPTRYLLSNFTIPLALEAMSGTAKRVTIVG